MPSLTDLFNPSFLMFLGILVLVVALLVVYFESKMRDQNHKIASMLSLVSTLAEDMNGVKMGLNHLAMTRVGGGMMPPFQQPLEQNINMPFHSNQENKLIEVSDDEDDDSENNESEFDDEESESEIESDDEDEDDESVNDVKILKINVNNEENDIDETENLDLEENMSFGDFEPEELEDHLSETQSVSSESSKLSSNYVGEILSLKYDNENSENKKNNDEQHLQISASDLKTININLEDSEQENIDYKKLQLNKLRSIVVEKGLSSNSDATKLKKQELLKLLGSE
jgi:hypothetical protein